MPKITQKVPLGLLTFNKKKTKLKLVKKGKKGTKESKLSLRSWLAFWEANKMWNFIVEYEIDNESKYTTLVWEDMNKK